MAKSRRIANDREIPPLSRTDSIGGSSSRSLFTASTGMQVVAAMASAAIVYVAYWTHDSTEVQQGAARYLVAWLIVAAIIACLSVSRVSRLDLAIDGVAWGLAGWMAISLIANSHAANLRLGINEWGWWIAIAALVSIGRRVAIGHVVALSLMRLIIAVSIGVAVYGWHQLLIGFPDLIRQYKADPETLLRQAGIVAEQGSAMRIIFENRLYDGGPTGTFALANSLAVMLVGGFVAMIGTLAATWRTHGSGRRLLWLAGIVIVGFMLLATRSRSAVLAILLLSVWFLLCQIHQHQYWLQRIRSWWRGIIVSILLAFVSVAGIGYSLRSSEWIQQAPASLAIRFNYWRACFEMVRQAPVFGVGPGQFKSRYEQFRAAASSEQIADPHQFLLQTVTAGGVPALALLVTLIGLLVSHFRQQARTAIEGTVPSAHEEEVELGVVVDSGAVVGGGGSVVGGVLIAIVGVWLIGAGLGQLPVFDAAVLATLAAVGFAVLVWGKFGSVQNLDASFPSLSKIAGYSAVAMGLDLLASGGMTVPGVSLIAWMLIGIAVPATMSKESLQDQARLGFSGFTFGFANIAFASLVAWYVSGIAPLEKSQMLQNRFDQAWRRGQIDAAIESLQEATQEDRWDAEPWLQLASVFRSLAIAQPTQRMEWEEKWAIAEQETILRNSRDPVVLRQLGDGRLLHYQRYGERKMLAAADVLYEKAVKLSPSHETYAAQWAEVLRELGDDRAKGVAVESQKLSQAGGYYERRLDFTIILAAKFRGNGLAEKDARGSASKMLAELLPKLE